MGVDPRRRFPAWLQTVIALVVTAIWAFGFVQDLRGHYKMPGELNWAFFAVLSAVFGVRIWRSNNDQKP